MTLRFAPLVATLLLALSRLEAAEVAMPQLTSLEPARLSEKGATFTGEARLAYKDVVLYADEITYDHQKQIATARGNVVLIRGAQRLVTNELTYNLADRTYSADRFRVGEGDLLVEGGSASGTQENLSVLDASLTYGEPDPLSPVLRAKRVNYVEAEDKKDSVVKVEGARLGIGSVPIIPLPTLSETPKNPTFTDVHARARYTGNLGAELSLAATAAFDENINLGADLGIFTKRGVLFGPIGDYDSVDADGLGARGEFRTGYIQDQGSPGLDMRGDAIREDRGYVEWKHQQVVAPSVTLSGQVYYWSDSYATRDFRPDGYHDLQTPDTWFEAQKVGDNFVVSLATRVQVNDYALVQERLPELRFDGLPVELGGGFYHRINAGVAALHEDDPITGTSIRSDRADLYYGVNRPFSPREWMSVTPTAGARVTHYARTNPGSGQGDYTRVLGEVGFDSKLWETSGTWNYQNQRWGIDGLRHILTPTVAYRYSPSADVGQGYIPPIDDDVFNTYLRPLGLADRREVDRLPALNTVRLGLENTLQTRDKNHGSRDLAEFDLAIDQHLDADSAADDRLSSNSPAGSRSRSDLHSFLALNPAAWLRFDLYNRTTVQTGKMQELNTGLTLRDADVWNFRLGTHYLEDPVGARQIQEYTAAYGLRLNEIYSLVARLSLDSRTGDFTEQSITIGQRLSRFWTVYYEIVAYDGPRREDDFGISVSLEARSF